MSESRYDPVANPYVGPTQVIQVLEGTGLLPEDEPADAT